MNANHKECQDCGWRGMAEELDQAADAPDDQTHSYCPECGGTDIKDLTPDGKEAPPES